jgi:hypothetical protein
MTTERQRLANQQNARKSTGPITTEGKERSRRNALKHGLASGGEVLKPSDGRKYRQVLKELREHLQPVDVLEESLVERIALAHVRLKRCVAKDLADLERRKQRATTRWDQRQRRLMDLAIDKLTTNPADAIEELEASSLGCGWLIAEWRSLGDALEDAGCWSRAQATAATRMLGKDPEKALQNASVAKLKLGFLASSPELDADEVDAFFEESTAELEPQARVERLSRRLPDPEIGRAMLGDFVADEIARLEPLRDEIWEQQDGPDRQLAEDRSLVDSSIEGARTLRYEMATELSLHRNLNQLIRLRKIEPEQQTLNRWSKTGVSAGRIWRGTGWEYLRADGGTADDAAGSEHVGAGLKPAATAEAAGSERDGSEGDSPVGTAEAAAKSHWRASRQWHPGEDVAGLESQGSGSVGAGLKPAPTAEAAASGREGSGGGSLAATSEASPNAHWRASRQCHPESVTAEAEGAERAAAAVAEEAISERSNGSKSVLKAPQAHAPIEANFSEASGCGNPAYDDNSSRSPSAPRKVAEHACVGGDSMPHGSPPSMQ